MSELVYDCRNRLVSAGGVIYSYDAENIRISAETKDYREKYATDTVSSSLSRVLSVTRYEKGTGATTDISTDETAPGTTTLYIHGNGLIL